MGVQPKGDRVSCIMRPIPGTNPGQGHEDHRNVILAGIRNTGFPIVCRRQKEKVKS